MNGTSYNNITKQTRYLWIMKGINYWEMIYRQWPLARWFVWWLTVVEMVSGLAWKKWTDLHRINPVYKLHYKLHATRYRLHYTLYKLHYTLQTTLHITCYKLHYRLNYTINYTTNYTINYTTNCALQTTRYRLHANKLHYATNYRYATDYTL